MQVSSSKAISTAATAAVVVVIIAVVGAGAYFAFYSGSGSTTSSSTTTPTSTRTSTTTTTPSAATTATTATTQSFYAQTLNGGGSTFVDPLMQVWIVGFGEYTNNVVSINYQAVGSGKGIIGVQKGSYLFAGSDAPHKNSTGTLGTLLNIPESLGAVAIFYNIPGVSASLNLTGSIVADIYLRKVTMWNNASILALNPHVNATKLAHQITPVHRSDGSGTTYALTNYFTKVSPDWNASGKGYGTTVSWPATGELGGSGSGGVAALVQETAYSIGYADSYYSFNNKLLSAAIQNKAGNFEIPSLRGVTYAAANFSAQLQTNPTFTITNAPGAQSYPISTFTYILVWQNQSNQQVGYDMAQFFWWIVTSGQTYGPALSYPKLPPAMVTIDEALIAQMNYNGISFIHG